jgi:RNA recognition motif-containing protein
VQSATVITDEFSGQSKGFAFVEMTTAEEVTNAVRRFNDTELKRAELNEARPRESNFAGGNRDRNGGAGSRGRTRW